MDKAYSYVGDAELNDAELFRTERIAIVSNADIFTWLQKTQSHKRDGPLIFTFVVDTDGGLLGCRQAIGAYRLCAGSRCPFGG